MQYVNTNKSNKLLLGFTLFFLVLMSASVTHAETYKYDVVGIHYECDSWSNEQYPLINLCEENYVSLLTTGDPIWKSHVDKLAKRVMDSNQRYTLKTGEKLDLGEGYSIEAKQVDVDGEKVWLEFSKDGEYVDDEIIAVENNNTWNVELDNIQEVNNVVVLRVHVSQVFQGAVDSIAQIDGLWLIDYANAETLEVGDQFKEITITQIINGVDEYNLGYIIASKPEDAIIWGVAPLSLQFTDLSENAISWYWTFGDGTDSTEKNPMHTYTKAGQYEVSVKVTNSAGVNTAKYTGYINVVNSLEPPIAAFSASPTYGKIPLNVSFIDESMGSPTSWKWSFGDGNISTDQNPTHTYTKAGQYAVTLTASNVAGSNTITKLNYISVGNSVKAPVTAFSVSVIP